MAVEADYVYSQGRDEKDVIDNVNLTFNPATGANYPFSDRAKRPYPGLGRRLDERPHGAVRVSRAADRVSPSGSAIAGRRSATYTLSGLWNADSQPFSGLEPVPFADAPDLGGEWGLSADDQRHRAGVQRHLAGRQRLPGERAALSSAPGIRQATNYGGDLPQHRRDHRHSVCARTARSSHRNSLIAPAQNRTDLRVQQRIPLRGRMSIDAIAEVFNVFNRPNYGIGTQENNAQYLTFVSAQTRTAQLGFRLTF